MSNKVPYLMPPDYVLQQWKNRFKEDKKFKVGITWGGNPEHPNDHHRSFKLLQYVPLLETPGVSFYSFQKGERAQELNELLRDYGITDLNQDLCDFQDTAGALKAMDLIISADTAMVHISGAVGQQCWSLIPMRPDWRWMLDRDDSPWYPTMRLFRQTKMCDWDSVILRVRDELQKLV